MEAVKSMIGATELIWIVVIVIILFGATKLPQLGTGIGEAIKNFKKGLKDDAIDVSPEKQKLDREKDNEKSTQ
jgi:sec-independent protein translocase protein TatA